MSDKIRRASTTGNLTLLGRAVSSFFVQANDPANGIRRRESRESDRRSAIHNLRVEEARDYLDTFIFALRKLTQIRKAILHSTRTVGKSQTLEEIQLLTEMATRKKYRIEVLQDPVLNDLNEKLGLLVRAELECISELMKIVEDRGSNQKNLILERGSEGNERASKLVSAMRVRLNQLARSSSN